MPHAKNGVTPSRLLLVSNRLPITLHHEAGADPTLARSAGGLATALARLHAERDSLWIGWPGAAVRSAATRQRLERQLRDAYRCVPVFLSAQDIQRYYDGVCNRALWPLLHFVQAQVRYDEAEWEAYVQANRRFCEVIVREARGDECIWVHDYHLCLLPAMLRTSLPAARIGFFLHTPFPPPELFRILPCRDALLEGILGADVIGFQTFGYRQNHIPTDLVVAQEASITVSATFGHQKTRSESSNAIYLWDLRALSSKSIAWGGRRYDQGRPRGLGCGEQLAA